MREITKMKGKGLCFNYRPNNDAGMRYFKCLCRIQIYLKIGSEGYRLDEISTLKVGVLEIGIPAVCCGKV